MEDEEYNIHIDKTGRSRISLYKADGSHTSKSYPRVIMEKVLGRELRDDEEVHHKDENPMNNDPSNLIVMTKEEHIRLHALENSKYFDKIMKCDVCGKEFVWTAKRQGWYYRDLNRHKNRVITCSKRCAGRIARYNQLGIPIGDRYKGVACTIYNNTYYNYYNPYFRI